MEHIDNYDNHFVHIWNILIFFNYYFLSAIFFTIFINANVAFNHWKIFYKMHFQSLQQKQNNLWKLFKVNRMTAVVSNGVSIVDFKQVNVGLIQCWVSYMFEGNSIFWPNHFFSNFIIYIASLANLLSYFSGS